MVIWHRIAACTARSNKTYRLSKFYSPALVRSFWPQTGRQSCLSPSAPTRHLAETFPASTSLRVPRFYSRQTGALQTSPRSTFEFEPRVFPPTRGTGYVCHYVNLSVSAGWLSRANTHVRTLTLTQHATHEKSTRTTTRINTRTQAYEIKQTKTRTRK